MCIMYYTYRLQSIVEDCMELIFTVGWEGKVDDRDMLNVVGM